MFSYRKRMMHMDDDSEEEKEEEEETFSRTLIPPAISVAVAPSIQSGNINSDPVPSASAPGIVAKFYETVSAPIFYHPIIQAFSGQSAANNQAHQRQQTPQQNFEKQVCFDRAHAQLDLSAATKPSMTANSHFQNNQINNLESIPIQKLAINEPTNLQKLAINEPTNLQKLAINEPTYLQKLAINEPTNSQKLAINEPQKFDSYMHHQSAHYSAIPARAEGSVNASQVNSCGYHHQPFHKSSSSSDVERMARESEVGRMPRDLMQTAPSSSDEHLSSSKQNNRKSLFKTSQYPDINNAQKQYTMSSTGESSASLNSSYNPGLHDYSETASFSEINNHNNSSSSLHGPYVPPKTVPVAGYMDVLAKRTSDFYAGKVWGGNNSSLSLSRSADFASDSENDYQLYTNTPNISSTEDMAPKIHTKGNSIFSHQIKENEKVDFSRLATNKPAPIAQSNTSRFSKSIAASSLSSRSSMNNLFPDSMGTEEFMQILGKQYRWFEEEVKQDTQILIKNRLRCVADLRAMQTYGWSEMKELLPVVKDKIVTFLMPSV